MEEKRQASKSFRDLIVWQKTHELVLGVYKATQAFPREEAFALTSQIRISAMSVAANIAEGFKKTSSKDKVRFITSRRVLCPKRSISCCYHRILSMVI